ncbi:MAG: WecB/TagA/CpsF family glycosyltransferase [Melioribacteraceae bacterium]|nr:WecB/TagA/CpsF family glycosyltransferase [Melioribacteraceae bacterium]
MISKTFFGLRVNYIESDELLKTFQNAMEKDEKICITYVSFHTLNLVKSNSNLEDIFSCFDVIHPDGVGVYFSSKFLFGFKEKIKPFTGSDFYEELIQRAIQNDWSLFFFGDRNEVVNNISSNIPSLNIIGVHSGYDYDTNSLIFKIQSKKPDILIIGLGQPLQEKWIIENIFHLNAKVILAVGDGIKVFAGNKIRGHKWVRKLGFEWLIRLINNPLLYWKRYLIGIPLFIVHVITEGLRTDA